jgi:hypothetical protein
MIWHTFARSTLQWMDYPSMILSMILPGVAMAAPCCNAIRGRDFNISAVGVPQSHHTIYQGLGDIRAVLDLVYRWNKFCYLRHPTKLVFWNSIMWYKAPDKKPLPE